MLSLTKLQDIWLHYYSYNYNRAVNSACLQKIIQCLARFIGQSFLYHSSKYIIHSMHWTATPSRHQMCNTSSVWFNGGISHARRNARTIYNYIKSIKIYYLFFIMAGPACIFLALP